MMDRTNEDRMAGAAAQGLPAYFDMQARIGHTKHIGGWLSTLEITQMMQLKSGQELLYVGCGSGLAAIKISQTFDCRVLGVDVMEEMVASALEWVERRGADQVEFRIADAQKLPFDNDRFDAVLCESVNTFVPDVKLAVNEYVRVAKPGGFVGLNEAVWHETPPEKGAQLMSDLTGQRLRQAEEWAGLLENAGLLELQVRTYPVQMKKESRSQMGFLTLGDLLRIVGRSISSFFTDPETRALMRLALDEPRMAYDYMGYGLFVGRVPGTE